MNIEKINSILCSLYNGRILNAITNINIFIDITFH
jgi:hypothetical protein